MCGNPVAAMFVYPLGRLGIIPIHKAVHIYPDRYEDSLVTIDQVDPEIGERFARLISHSDEDGYLDPIIENLHVEDTLDSKAYCLILRHESGTHAVQFSSTRSGQLRTNEEIVFTFADEQRSIVTTNGKRKFNTRPNIEATFLVGSGVDAVIAAHLERISGLNPLRIDSRQTLIALIDKTKTDHKENLLNRGIYEPIDS